METMQDCIAEEFTINGASLFNGKMAILMMSKSLIIINKLSEVLT